MVINHGIAKMHDKILWIFASFTGMISGNSSALMTIFHLNYYGRHDTGLSFAIACRFELIYLQMITFQHDLLLALLFFMDNTYRHTILALRIHSSIKVENGSIYVVFSND